MKDWANACPAFENWEKELYSKELDAVAGMKTNRQEIACRCNGLAVDFLKQEVYCQDCDLFDRLLDGCKLWNIGLDELSAIIADYFQILRNLEF